MENDNSLRKICLLYSFLVCLFIFQSLAKKGDDKLLSNSLSSLNENALKRVFTYS